MTQQVRPVTGEVQYYQFNHHTESGFIIRPEDSDTDEYKAEEWRNGDIVEQHYGSYAEMVKWTETVSQTQLFNETAQPTITDAIIASIRNGVLSHFSEVEAGEILACGINSLVEIDEKQVIGAARVHLVSGKCILVINPLKVCEGLLTAFTPMENESKMLIQTSTIASISFSG